MSTTDASSIPVPEDDASRETWWTKIKTLRAIGEEEKALEEKQAQETEKLNREWEKKAKEYDSGIKTNESRLTQFHDDEVAQQKVVDQAEQDLTELKQEIASREKRLTALRRKLKTTKRKIEDEKGSTTAYKRRKTQEEQEYLTQMASVTKQYQTKRNEIFANNYHLVWISLTVLFSYFK